MRELSKPILRAWGAWATRATYRTRRISSSTLRGGASRALTCWPAASPVSLSRALASRSFGIWSEPAPVALMTTGRRCGGASWTWLLVSILALCWLRTSQSCLFGTKGLSLSAFFESFRDLGYSVTARVINCFEHGVPQHRARLFIVANRDVRAFRWPEPRRKRTTLRDAIGDLPVVPGGQRHEELRYRARQPLTPFQKRMRTGLPPASRTVIHDHITRAVRHDDWEAYGELEQGQTYADLPRRLRRYRSDIFTDKYKRLAWDELSRTITAHLAKDGYWYIHPEQHRTLSIREAARLQTFPDHVRFAGAPSHRYRQIGNAVPPMMAESIGKAIIATLKNQTDLPPGPPLAFVATFFAGIDAMQVLSLAEF